MNNYAQSLLEFLYKEDVFEVDTLTLTDDNTPDGTACNLTPSLEPPTEKDIIGSTAEIEGDVPQGGIPIKVKSVIDLRSSKDAVLVFDKKRKCYIKKRKGK